MAQLGDILAGAAGSPVNRPALNAYITQGQAMAGLRTAQTEDALQNAQRMREEQQASDDLEGALANLKGPDGKPMFTPSETHFTATQMKFMHGGALPALQAIQQAQKNNSYGVVADPNADPNARLSNLDAMTGKVQSPYTQDQGQLVNNMAPGAATQPAVTQTPMSTATEGDKNADAFLKTQEGLHPTQFHPSVANAPLGLSQSDVDVLGDRFYETGQMPALGMGASPLRTAILASAAARARGERQPVAAQAGGTAAGNMLGNAAYNKANTNAMSAMQRQAGLVGAYETTASANLDLAMSYLGKLDSSGSPLVDRGLRQWSAGVTGDPDTQSFILALNTARSEYERVVSGASGAQGITDQARKEGEKMFPTGITPQQLPGVIHAAKLDMANRVAGFQNQLKHTKDLIASGGDAAATAPVATQASQPTDANAPPVALLKEGTITHFANGQSWALRNGVPVQVK